MKVFVSTYAKANAGDIGAWFDLEDYSDLDEFYAACAEFHNDEDPDALEFRFLDTEDIPKDFLDGDSLNPDIYEIANHGNPEMILAYLDNVGLWSSVSALIEQAEEAYQGEYANWGEFAEEIFAEVYDIPDHLINYIDWEKVGRDLGHDYFESNGHYFRNL